MLHYSSRGLVVLCFLLSSQLLVAGNDDKEPPPASSETTNCSAPLTATALGPMTRIILALTPAAAPQAAEINQKVIELGFHSMGVWPATVTTPAYIQGMAGDSSLASIAGIKGIATVGYTVNILLNQSLEIDQLQKQIVTQQLVAAGGLDERVTAAF